MQIALVEKAPISSSIQTIGAPAFDEKYRRTDFDGLY
jgi:hypothetical protein